MIKIDFEIQNEKYGVYRDALHLPEDHGMTDEQIEAMKQERYDNWVNIIENPPVVEEQPQIEIPNTLTIGGEEYTLLEGTPPSGAKLIEVNSNWYYKV